MVAAFDRWKILIKGSDEDCVNKVKRMCRQPMLGGPALKCNEVSYTQEIRENYAKTATPSASFAYILRQAPNHKLSNELMSNLLWPKDVKFPYGLSKGITVASPTSDAEDEKAEDD